MYCKYCGEKNTGLAKFCKKCGKEISRKFIKLKKIRKIWFIVPVVVILVIFLINGGELSSFLNVYPFLAVNSKTETLKCNYAGKDYKVDTTLYSNINNYYYNLPNQNSYIENQDYSKFVYSNPKDNTIKNLANEIEKIANVNKLDPDQTLELTTCLVQNIPYDSNEFNQIMNGTGNTAQTEQFPYETLYNNKGVCTDKTYLGSALLKEMGYGTAIMIFPNDGHMALGISVPEGYTSFGSKYAYMELTTPGFTPGSIPTAVEKNNGLPNPNIKNIDPLKESDNPDQISLDVTKEIAPPSKVISVNNGKPYVRIVIVKKIEKEVIELLNSLDGKKANLQKANGDISYWNDRQAQTYSNYLATPPTTQSCHPICSYYPYYSCRQNCYTLSNPMKNLAYSTYTNAYNNYKNAINNYNNLVNDYNNTLKNINDKIEIYKKYQY